MTKDDRHSTSQRDRFSALVHRSVPPVSRRHFLRASAVATAAGAFGTASVSGARAARSTEGALARAQAENNVETDVEITIPFTPYGQSVSLDPHEATNWGPFWVLMPHVWAGLLRFDENGAVVPDLAESIETEDDGTTWVATLRDDIAYTSGNPVVAEDFIISWNHALELTAVAPMTEFFAPVAGYDEYLAGEATELGFEARDERTVAITLSEPTSAFPSYLATFGWAVIDPTVLEENGADIGLSDGNAGAWTFTEFVPGEQIVMEPNPNYWDEPSPSVTRVVWRIFEGADADQRALEAYRNDDVVSADVPTSLFAEVSDDDDLNDDLVEVDLHTSTVAIGMDFSQSPFDDVRVRRAVAASIDRDVWASDIWEGSFVAASSLTPSAVEETAGYSAPDGIGFDPAEAEALLEEADYDPESSPDEIVYYQPATDPIEDLERHAALLEMIEEHSGIAIRHDTSLTQDQIAQVSQDEGGRQFDIVWWWSATETPALLATVGDPESEAMVGVFNWSDGVEESGDYTPGEDAERFSELIAEATAEMDEAARNDAYSEAEELLLENAVYIPLGQWVQRWVQKPWLEGTRQGPWSGRIPVAFNGDVVVRNREESA